MFFFDLGKMSGIFQKVDVIFNMLFKNKQYLWI